MSTYEISKSSLLSLKAEILRKQQELSKAKAENEIKKKVLKKNPLEIKNKGVESREKNDQSDVDEDLLKQSRSILEYKAKLYDKLSTEKQSEEDVERNKQYLVRFDKKKGIEDLPPEDSEPDDKRSESDDNCYESDDNTDRDPGEKWVDYVDCFGRTRKCMQKDLEYLKSKDKELEKIVEEKKKEFNTESEIKDPANGDASVHESEKRSEEEFATNLNETPEMSSSDMRRELLRQQWEKEEEELRNKSDIHYQDLLFGEARSHGTGYYGFSKDEEERAKQQEALRKLRQETEMQQKKSQELKSSREKLLAARLKAARTRKRARMGLPPEEDVLEPEAVPPPEPPIENKESENQKETERLLGEARKNHVRPWDIGKEGVKEHQIMSQAEWVDKKREERPQEFAPPTIYRKNFRADIKQDETEEIDTNKSLKFTSRQKFRSKDKDKKKYFNREKEERTETLGDELLKDYETRSSTEASSLDFDDRLLKDYEKVRSDIREKVPTPMDSLNSLDFDDSLLRDYEKSIKKKSKIEIKLNYKQPPNIQPIPIDEDSDLEEVDIVSDGVLTRGKGVEIAPPPTYDYYGPGQSKVRKKEVKQANIEQSINEGLQFLRKQVEEKEKSKKQFRDMFLF